MLAKPKPFCMICEILHEYELNFNSFGAKHVSPRTLAASFLGNMVCVEGIVTKCESTSKKQIYLNIIVIYGFDELHSTLRNS